MFQSMEKALIQNRIYTIPVIYIKPDIEKALAVKLKEMIRKKYAQVAESEETATHICYPSVDVLEEEYGRPIFKRDKMVMMHWYYFPHSFDTWVNLDVSAEGLSSDINSPRAEAWRVSCAWLMDTDHYNEWMSEEDYEVDYDGHKKVHPQRMSVEDVMNPSNDDRSKKKQKRKRSPSPPSKVGKRKSGRSPAVGKKQRPDEEQEDFTKDMEEPIPEPNIVEVNTAAPNQNSKKDHELQPLKGGSVADLEESEERGEDSQNGKNCHCIHRADDVIQPTTSHIF